MGIVSSCFHLEDCSSSLGDVWLLLVAVKSSNAEEKPVGWHQALEEKEAKRHEHHRGRVRGVRDQTWGPSRVRKSRKGHRDRAHTSW